MIRWEGETVVLSFYVQPNAKEDKVVGVFQDHLKIQITAPATENKANNHLKKWLSKQCKVPLSQVSLIKGEHSRYKVLSIKSPQSIPSWFNDL
jgi:hypothetical protein